MDNNPTIRPAGNRDSFVPFRLLLKGNNERIDLKEGTHTIGCGDVDIRIGLDDKYISDHQATLTVKRNLIGEWCLYLQDMPDTINLTRINGEICKDEFAYRLYHEDIVRMGLTYVSIECLDEW